MKHKIILFLSILLIVSACVGCRNQTQNKDLSQKTQEQVNNENPNEDGQNKNTPDKNISSDTEAVNPTNGEDLFKISKLRGTVTDFCDNRCTITPTVEEGEVAYEAAPGYDAQQEHITISYADGCTFQIAYVNIQTGEVTYDTASLSDIKKQTNLVICGEYDSDNILHATHIFIYRNME